MLVLSNDVVPGFGVPVAAPGLRSAGIAAGLRSHGFDVELVVPADVARLAGIDGRPAPDGAAVVELPELMDHIATTGVETVVFTNANLTPHLRPQEIVSFVYDLFAPKMLERLASPAPEAGWDDLAEQKERALALADAVWVNGRRKLGYALAWMMRPGVEAHRNAMGKASMFASDPASRVQLVEMPVLPVDTASENTSGTVDSEHCRIGIGGYAQPWSTLPEIHPAHRALSDAGHEIHALIPQHWAAGDTPAPASALPEAAVMTNGPLALDAFHGWVRSMDVMVDVFPKTAERRLAMITRSAVALGWGVPVIHGVDSEVADIIREFNAGWVETSEDPNRWRAVAEEAADPEIRAVKRAGAIAASRARFDPHAALAEAANHLRNAS